MRRAWQRILEHVELTALLPGGIWRGRAPETARRPMLVWRRIDDTTERALRGPVGVGRGTYDVRVIADDGTRAEVIADALRRSLDGFRGTQADNIVLGVFLEERADEDEDDESSIDPTTIARLRMTVWYRESEAT